VRNYIGLACSPHDPALAILNSKGEVVFAEATERFLQSKKAWNVPPDCMIRVKYLLEKYIEDDAELVVSTTWSNKSLRIISFIHPLLKKSWDAFVPSIISAKANNLITGLITSGKQTGNNIHLRYKELNPNSRILKRSYDHHLTHAAAACYSSPFSEAICVIVDGFGEASSTAIFKYEDGKISPLLRRRISKNFGASLGVFYSYLCSACGFDPIEGEEWKVMGLSCYGSFDHSIYETLRPIIKVENCRLVGSSDQKFRYSELLKMRRAPHESPFESANLAYTGQKVFCEVFQELLNDIYDLNISENLILSGGCALNSSWNGQILEKTLFKNLYVFCAPGDDGNALGACLHAYFEDNPNQVSLKDIRLPYLGDEISKKSLDRLQKLGKLKNVLHETEKIHERAAELISEGKIIGWIGGKAEFGPRALGNRSILADARDPMVKEKLNSVIKHRETFRPFAPSILHEYGDVFFENYQESPYMERTLRFRNEVKGKVPGVVHVDGTGRLQSVKREWNEKFYDLIASFNKITGIPLVLNTSFNIMGKPIVHSVEDAIALFFTSGLDALVIEDNLFVKSNV
jgi:carbamoyltransferase